MVLKVSIGSVLALRCTRRRRRSAWPARLARVIRCWPGCFTVLLESDQPEKTLGRATAIAAMAVTQIGFGISDDAQLARLESGVVVRTLTEQ